MKTKLGTNLVVVKLKLNKIKIIVNTKKRFFKLYNFWLPTRQRSTNAR
jgi:hypothetical protein